MSNLEIVKQESKTNLLQTGPMPHEEMKIGSCTHIVTRGEREGHPCGEKTFDGAELCEGHKVLLTRKKAKEEIKEVNVQVRASQPHLPIIQVAQPLPLAPVLPPPNAPIDEILVIMRNFSIAMVNLTELLKRH